MLSEKIPYDPLIALWRLWIDQPQWPALDKWLKNHFRQQAKDQKSAARLSRTKSFNKDNARSEKLNTENAEFGLWMISAVRYAQLACALEACYQKQEISDWKTWDADWSTQALKKIPPAVFWYWVGLREQGAQASAPRALRDASFRQEWFLKNCEQWQAAEFGEQQLLWNGLRPAFIPALIERKNKEQWSDETFTKFLIQQNQTPPLWLRAQKNISVDELMHRLNDESVIVGREGENIYASGGQYLFATETFKEGWVEVQDLASQQIALAVAAQPGEKVWDACAGAGGKSLAIASRMNNKGAVIATDIRAYKLDELKQRAKRGELHNIRAFEWNGDEPLRLPKEVAQQKGFDWVLVDAPCSASGTWRRNPDARWRCSEKDTQELITLQQKILQNAAPAVKQNGFLVYATCSWQVKENEEQVDWFLKANSNFELVKQTMLGYPAQNSDTMFVAVLKQK